MSIAAPIVPDVPGVPALLPSGVAVPLPPDLSADTTGAILSAGAPRWGIYLDGALVLQPDSFLSLEYKKDWHLSDYPIEGGAFESYNKVRLPYEQRVALTKGATEADRAAFLATLEDLAASLDLYDIVTPEWTYTNANITHFDYRRTSQNGVSLLTVYVWFQEIRVQASSTFTTTATADGAAQRNGGTVQPSAATPAQVQVFRGHGATGSW